MIIPQKIQRRMDLHESFLMAADFKFIGKLTLNKYDADSIFNNFGIYGSKFSALSLCNQYSVYGNPYSHLSAYNLYTTNPPYIILRGKLYGRLSKNRYLNEIVVNPDNIVEWMHQVGLY